MILFGAIFLSFAIGVLIGALAMQDIQQLRKEPTYKMPVVNGHEVAKEADEAHGYETYICRCCEMEADDIMDFETVTACPDA